MSEIETICEYWFGSHLDDAAVAAQRSAVWWKKNPDVDAEIRARFEPLVTAAGRGELSRWAESPRGLLALILLTDQFPRNIYRDTARAFAFDSIALGYCRDGLAREVDRKLRPIERIFHYLPLEHSESLADQHESVRLFSRLVEAATPAAKPLFEGYLNFAERHRDIIARFGRFPHRNRILGRASTAEEQAFLEQPGSSF